MRAATEFLVSLPKATGYPRPSAYSRWLDAQTQALMAKFPIENLWDPARKCVNIFMVMASLNTFLREAYALERFEFVLEVPLDNTVERKLRRFGRRQKRFTREEFPRWNGIKSLDTTNSEKYQSLALEMAKQLGIPRGQLDVVLF